MHPRTRARRGAQQVSGLFGCLVILIALVVAGGYCVTQLGSDRGPSSGVSRGRASPPRPSVPAYRLEPVKGTVKTPKGKFKVPGKAYIDGRDRDAKPPLTLRTVNVWSGAGRLQARERVVCEIKHGTKLSVTGAVRHTGEERYYFHAEAGGCSGWVPETFVGRKKYKRVGSWYP